MKCVNFVIPHCERESYTNDKNGFGGITKAQGTQFKRKMERKFKQSKLAKLGGFY